MNNIAAETCDRSNVIDKLLSTDSEQPSSHPSSSSDQCQQGGTRCKSCSRVPLLVSYNLANTGGINQAAVTRIFEPDQIRMGPTGNANHYDRRQMGAIALPSLNNSTPPEKEREEDSQIRGVPTSFLNLHSAVRSQSRENPNGLRATVTNLGKAVPCVALPWMAQDMRSSGLKLIDTKIQKTEHGFGLTLVEILAFIPMQIFDRVIQPASVSHQRHGFYQRLLQIRHISGKKANTKPNVELGDILLAIGQHRLAGCAAEYVTRILTPIPTGMTLNVTILRGLPFAQICETATNVLTGRNHRSAFTPQMSSQRKLSKPVAMSDRPRRRAFLPANHPTVEIPHQNCYMQKPKTLDQTRSSHVDHNRIVKHPKEHRGNPITTNFRGTTVPECYIQSSPIGSDKTTPNSAIQETRIIFAQHPFGQEMPLGFCLGNNCYPNKTREKRPGLITPHTERSIFEAIQSMSTVCLGGAFHTPDYVPASYFFNNISPKIPPSAPNFEKAQSTSEQQSSCSPLSSIGRIHWVCSLTTMSLESLESIRVDIPKRFIDRVFVFEKADVALFQVASIEHFGPQINSELLHIGDILLAVGTDSTVLKGNADVEKLLRFHADTSPTSSVQLLVGRHKQNVYRILGASVHKVAQNRANKISTINTGQNAEEEGTMDVALERDVWEGFGFVLVSPLRSYELSEIGQIIPGSPADRCGLLKVGQRIMAINKQSIVGLHHNDVVRLIKNSHQKLILTVKVNGTVVSEALSKPVIHEAEDTRRTECPSLYSVVLEKGLEGFGFSIRGGMEFDHVPLFIYRLARDGPASADGRIQVGDEILEINGIPTNLMTHQQAVNVIQHCEHHLNMLLSRQSTRLYEATV